jgi:hypothetical protein
MEAKESLSVGIGHRIFNNDLIFQTKNIFQKGNTIYYKWIDLLLF